MTVIHIVMIKFRPEVTQEHKVGVANELREMKKLDSVKGHRLVVGGPSITGPVKRNKGIDMTLLSFHDNEGELERYRNSEEHRRITSTSIFPYQDDLIKYDFNVPPEDEYMWDFLSNENESARRA